jgi:hypothetical protein
MIFATLLFLSLHPVYYCFPNSVSKDLRFTMESPLTHLQAVGSSLIIVLAVFRITHFMRIGITLLRSSSLPDFGGKKCFFGVNGLRDAFHSFNAVFCGFLKGLSKMFVPHISPYLDSFV